MTYEKRHSQTQWYHRYQTILNFLLSYRHVQNPAGEIETDCFVTIATVIANNTKTDEDILKIAKQAIKFDFYEDAIHYLKTEFKLEGIII